MTAASIASRPAALPVAVLGAGRMGLAIALMLRHAGGYTLRVADRDPARLAPAAALGCETVALGGHDAAAMARAVRGCRAALNALPFHCAVDAATACQQAGVHYFDLTEDVPSTRAIQALAEGARTVLMPQCGLAPGFVGVLGHALAARFDQPAALHLRVGALPRRPDNALRYKLTWSTEGLINEYCNPCEAIAGGRRVELPALDGLERLVLDGVAYEAFNTSGGLGTLTHTLPASVRRADYKSIRYPGHGAIMKLLLNDLRLRDRRELLREIFESALGTTLDDVVLIAACASGLRGGRPARERFSARILGAELDGHTLSAIQRCTAAGICAALDLVVQGVLPQAGFVGAQQVPLAALLANRFGAVYAERVPLMPGAGRTEKELAP